MPEWLRERARLSPDKPGLVCGDANWTFAELDRRVSATALRLATRGIRSGDHVALIAANGSGFVQLVHAIPRLSAVLVPLSIRLTVDELAWQLADSTATCLVYDEVSSSKAAELTERLPSVTGVPLAELTRPQEDIDAGQAAVRDLGRTYLVRYFKCAGRCSRHIFKYRKRRRNVSLLV